MALGGLFGGSSSSAPVTATKVDSSAAEIKEKWKAQIAQELAVANATELVNKMTENCFEQCLKAPYQSTEDGCVNQCLEKYMRAWNTISKTYIQRIQQASK